MEIPRDNIPLKSPLLNNSKKKKQEDFPKTVKGRAYYRGMPEPIKKVEEKKVIKKEEPEKLNRIFTRGQMMDMLMEFPRLKAVCRNYSLDSDSYIVRYDKDLEEFYCVNKVFNFSIANINEEWMIIE